MRDTAPIRAAALSRRHKGFRGFLYEMGKNKTLYLMMLPTVIFLIINNYLPMLGLSIAFVDFRAGQGILGSKWVGFQNFKFFFSTNDFLTITRNTVCYNAVYIVLDISVAAFCAIAINELRNQKAGRVYNAFMLMSFFLSWVVVNYIFYSFLSVDRGFLNKTILPALGLEPVSWYREGQYWPFILVFAQLWRYTGYNTILLYSGLLGIDKQYYEAALIDGATKWKQIRYVTIPLLSPVIVAMFLMLVGRIFYADFGLHFQVPNNSPAIFAYTDVLDTYVYRALRQLNNYPMASAAGFYQATVGMVIVVIANRVVKRLDPEKSLF